MNIINLFVGFGKSAFLFSMLTRLMVSMVIFAVKHNLFSFLGKSLFYDMAHGPVDHTILKQGIPIFKSHKIRNIL